MTDVETLPLTGERTVPGIAEENYWFSVTRTVYDQGFHHVTHERCAHGFVGKKRSLLPALDGPTPQVRR